MMHYDCHGVLNVSSQSLPDGKDLVHVNFQHDTVHCVYNNVTMPIEALEMVHCDVKDATPDMLVSKIQRHFKNVSRQQVYNTWAMLSEGLWKHNSDQPVCYLRNIQMTLIYLMMSF